VTRSRVTPVAKWRQRVTNWMYPAAFRDEPGHGPQHLRVCSRNDCVEECQRNVERCPRFPLGI
jgi:hypothetical protein